MHLAVAVYRATVVESYRNFWVNVTSEELSLAAWTLTPHFCSQSNGCSHTHYSYYCIALYVGGLCREQPIYSWYGNREWLVQFVHKQRCVITCCMVVFPVLLISLAVNILGLFAVIQVLNRLIYCVNCMKFGQLILRKAIQIVATRCHILRLKMHQIRFRLGLRFISRWGSLQRSPYPLAGFKGA